MTVPLWLVAKPALMLLGLLGPLGLLAYKPGENLVGKLVLVVLAAAPCGAVLLVLRRRAERLGERSRLMGIALASALWHLPAVALWIVIVSGLN